jgi:hypothetical protein
MKRNPMKRRRISRKPSNLTESYKSLELKLRKTSMKKMMIIGLKMVLKKRKKVMKTKKMLRNTSRAAILKSEETTG